MSETPLLKLEEISKNFGAVNALKNVNLTVDAGEVVALVGDNGAGKSTLIKCVAGIHPINGGKVFWRGEHVAINSPRDAARLGIEIVYQDLALADNLDVVENMFLGREKLTKARRLDKNQMEREALDTLSTLAVTTIKSVRKPVGGLSGGQRQSVAVAKAVMWSAKLVILDEPTAALGVAQTRQVLELVKRLRSRGLGVLLVSHNLNDIFEVADRIVVLRLGENAADFDRANATQTEVVEAITTGRRNSTPSMAKE